MACAGSVGLAVLQLSPWDGTSGVCDAPAPLAVPQLSPWDGTSGACAAPAALAVPADTGAVSHTHCCHQCWCDSPKLH